MDGPESERRAARRVWIVGRVQGVGFRYWTAARAEALRLTGYVRNLSDGSVEALLIGDAQDVARMLTLLGEGPAGARVDAVRSASPAPGERLDHDRFRRAPTAEPDAPPP